MDAKFVCYLNFVPGCDSNFDKCTVTMEQMDTHITHLSASTAQDRHKQTCVHTPSSSVSVCDWLVLVPCPTSLTNELEAAPYQTFSSNSFIPAQSHVGQQGQTTFKDNSSFFFPLVVLVCISMENEQECKPVVPNPPPAPETHFPSICLSPSFLMYLTDRQMS